MTALCKILGHKVGFDDIGGGTMFQVCTRKGCTWVGRCVYDHFADTATREEIAGLNKKHGIRKILNHESKQATMD
ncbi:MAG: hypothetical protein M0R80_00900 [Proteobacteria bacterium]|jgi:hypothetical protein|nr:hypothetical protein [Pseudomonadota bacterium]